MTWLPNNHVIKSHMMTNRWDQCNPHSIDMLESDVESCFCFLFLFLIICNISIATFCEHIDDTNNNNGPPSVNHATTVSASKYYKCNFGRIFSVQFFVACFYGNRKISWPFPCSTSRLIESRLVPFYHYTHRFYGSGSLTDFGRHTMPTKNGPFLEKLVNVYGRVCVLY